MFVSLNGARKEWNATFFVLKYPLNYGIKKCYVIQQKFRTFFSNQFHIVVKRPLLLLQKLNARTKQFLKICPPIRVPKKIYNSMELGPK